MKTMLRLMAARGEGGRGIRSGRNSDSATTLAAGALEPGGGRRGGVHHFTDAGVASWYDFAEAIGEDAMRRGF